MRVAVLHRRFPHHSAYSGYSQIVGPLAGVEYLPSWSPWLLPDRVEAHTGISDHHLRALYRGADALFLPLVQATANNPLLEAMACGLPVVATDLVGVREHAGEAGAHLFARLDPAAAIEAIRGLAAESEGRRAELGRRSRERAEQLTWHVAATALSGVYREAWRSPARRAAGP